MGAVSWEQAADLKWRAYIFRHIYVVSDVILGSFKKPGRAGRVIFAFMWSPEILNNDTSQVFPVLGAEMKWFMFASDENPQV